jgi:hypothetical protein
MLRQPNPLLKEFLNKNIPLPKIHWETVPPDINPYNVWDGYDDTVEGWVPIWFPDVDIMNGRSYGEFERSCLFNDELERILKAMYRWPLWGNETQKKESVAYALLQMYCEVRGFCSRV